MQVSTLLSLLISSTCILVGTLLLLSTNFPPMSTSFSSLPNLVEQHTKVMLASPQHVCKFMFCLCVCTLYEEITNMKFSENCEYETTHRRGTAQSEIENVTWMFLSCNDENFTNASNCFFLSIFTNTTCLNANANATNVI